MPLEEPSRAPLQTDPGPFSLAELYSPDPDTDASPRESLELDSIPRHLKGKERYVPELSDAHETEAEAEDSDGEVEGLLRRGKEEHDGLAAEVQGARRRLKPMVGRAGKSSGWRAVLGIDGAGMSKVERKTFWWEMLSQTFPIMMLSLVGAILTGLLLAKLQQWRVFIRIEELFILVPILLNLKGNLEMNLAARFSTSANIGELDMRLTRRSLIFGNLALLQVQALLVSLLSGLLAFILGLLSRNGVHHALQNPIYNPALPDNAATYTMRGGYFEALLVLCVSMLAASISSAVLGSFMCALVVLCRKFRINPDNIATPLASALGDLVTLVILGGLSSLFVKFMGTLVSTAVFLLLMAAIGVNLVITFRNAYVQELLSVGWGPLFAAMAISSASGLVLEAYVNEFQGFAIFSTVVNALSGNAGSIFVSRISTALHSSRKEHYWSVSFALFGITSPILLLFLGFVWLTGQAPVTMVFTLSFIVLICIQMVIALTIAYYLTILLWCWDYDPDVYALPLLSSFLDVTGQLMLVGAFALARSYAGVPVDPALELGT